MLRRALFVLTKRSFLRGILKVLLVFQKISLKSGFGRKWNDLLYLLGMNSMRKRGKRSSIQINTYPLSTCLRVSGIKPEPSFIVGFEETANGVRLTFRKDRRSSLPTASIVLNFVWLEDHGHVRLKTLMSFRDWCTVIKLLKELSDGDTPTGS